jgi:hypothetical protein
VIRLLLAYDLVDKHLGLLIIFLHVYACTNSGGFNTSKNEYMHKPLLPPPPTNTFPPTHTHTRTHTRTHTHTHVDYTHWRTQPRTLPTLDNEVQMFYPFIVQTTKQKQTNRYKINNTIYDDLTSATNKSKHNVSKENSSENRNPQDNRHIDHQVCCLVYVYNLIPK